MIYRKHGTVARWENGTLIRVTECGIAIEEGDYFECRPDVECGGNGRMKAGRMKDEGIGPAFSFFLLHPSGLHPSIASALQSLRDVTFERLIITHGVADHECEGRTWREETDRIHASLTHGKLRALVDSTTRRLDDIITIANALQRAEQTEREAPPRLRIEPNVTAALLPHLVGRTPSNVRLVQSAGGVDGYGNDIVEAERDWPNAYRPSYRVRPVHMPLNLRLECASTGVDERAPRAIALLAPVTGLAIRVLIADDDDVYPATVAVERIQAVAADRVWYPYGGGSFGAALML
jgi:hypothetical protein